ncbi:hypothetical protein DIP38_01650, partial [Neisseria gonorrhoeae]
DLSARKLIGYNGFLRFYVLDSRLRGNDAFHLPPPPEKRKKMPSEGLSDGICGKTGRAGGSEEDFAPA